ncbi:class F sortase [Streptomyces sp. W16]|uniref:class F sortase n=1 Tax=Streptomyces sp. W16 TaxID=3076631 RepID=UPI00295A5FCD|nr:class F sortase [Streptomyces sp. W16]MDV9178870.1 class F sortase [Streptomyces sp. W16]
MTSLSRRAFVTASTAALLTGCGGGHGTAPAANSTTKQGSSNQGGATPSASPAVRPVHALARSVPVTLRVPAIGVDTPVMQLGLASDGTVQVPPITAHDRAGWYRYSPTPGRTGPSVILGHVTVGAYGDGVFRHLARLRAGDRIDAVLENGTTATFTVTAVRTVAKADFPSDEVYGNVDRPELRLITCGGTRTGTGYLDNVIVFAALTAASP